MTRRYLTTEEEIDLVKRYYEGATRIALTAEFGVSRTAVRNDKETVSGRAAPNMIK